MYDRTKSCSNESGFRTNYVHSGIPHCINMCSLTNNGIKRVTKRSNAKIQFKPYNNKLIFSDRFSQVLHRKESGLSTIVLV